MKHTKNAALFMVLLGFIFFSCSRSGKNERSSLADRAAKDAVEEKVREFIYPLPTAFEITNILVEVGASYIIDLSNDYNNASNYFTQKSMALNLGVYGADLSYSSTYQMKQETIYYMEASKKLTDGLGIPGIIDEQLLEKVEQSIDDKDELIETITNTFYDTYDELNKSGKQSLALLIAAGSWIEAVYIATHISANVYNNYELVSVLHDQKESVDKLFEMLETSSSEPSIQEIMNDLAPLKAIFDEMDESLTEQQVNSIATEIEKLRTKIIAV
jgi:hypothetical protein